jgi:hypothetical protein
MKSGEIRRRLYDKDGIKQGVAQSTWGLNSEFVGRQPDTCTEVVILCNVNNINPGKNIVESLNRGI